MDSTVVQFLDKHTIGALAILLPDGTPHAAALHYSYHNDPLTIFFSTEKSSKKSQALLSGATVKASFVIGFSEKEWATVQMDGEVKSVTDASQLAKIKEMHYAKHPESQRYENEPETLFLAFTPNWWRYTDYNTQPPTIKTSK